MNAFVRLLYALLIAGAVTAFAGVAIFSFYQPPSPPPYPSSNYAYDNPAYQRQQDSYQRALDKQDKAEKTYNRNVSYMLLPMAILSALAGFYLIRKRSEVIGEGLALGGVAISIYAIIMASLADARILRLATVSMLLVVALLTAHFRFMSPQHKKSKGSIY